MSPHRSKTIAVPVHPDEEKVPMSSIYFPLSEGKYAVFRGPLAPKTLGMLAGALKICKAALVAKPAPAARAEDFSI